MIYYSIIRKIFIYTKYPKNNYLLTLLKLIQLAILLKIIKKYNLFHYFKILIYGLDKAKLFFII